MSRLPRRHLLPPNRPHSHQPPIGPRGRLRAMAMLMVLVVQWLELDRSPCRAHPPNAVSQDPSSPRAAERRPTRILELVTGEVLVVEWLGADDKHCQVRWDHRIPLAVPWSIIAVIRNPTGWIDVYDAVDDESRASEPSRQIRGPQRVPIDASLDAGLIEVRPQPLSTTPLPTVLELSLENGRNWRISCSPEGIVESAIPAGWNADFRQVLRPFSERSVLQVCWDRQRYRILLDDQVREAGSTDGTAIVSIVRSNDQPRSSVVGPLVVRRQIAASVDARPPALAVGLTLSSGDVLSGRVRSADARGIHWGSDTGQSILVRWTEFVGLRMAADSMPPPSAFVSGPLTDLLHQSADVTTHGSIERLRGVLVPPRRLEHPYLGPLTFTDNLAESDGWTIRRFPATGWQWLEPALLHLGDEIDTDVPMGHQVAGEFSWTATDEPTAIVLTTWGLEPCGEKTPSRQPFLAELKAGGLRTRLIINDRLIAELNEHVQRRAPELDPDTIRLSLPAGLLHSGINRWELRQLPFSQQNPQFDDCRIGRIAIETR